VNTELEMDMNGNITHYGVPSHYLPGGTEENHKIFVRTGFEYRTFSMQSRSATHLTMIFSKKTQS
jgi:hypothetical protein